MSTAIRNYFDAKVSVTPAPFGPPAPAQFHTSLPEAWKELSKQLFFVLPNQLDRARVNRNRFMAAVR